MFLNEMKDINAVHKCAGVKTTSNPPPPAALQQQMTFHQIFMKNNL